MKNMLIIFLILLVLWINVINGLSCIGPNVIEISLDKLTHKQFQKQFDELVPYDGDDPNDIVACDIIVTIDYTTHQLIIEFDTTLKSASNSNIRDAATLYTKFTRTPARGHTSELFIKCSFTNKCDESFLLNDNHYQWWWLINRVNHTKIQGIFNKLFIDDKNTTSALRCYDNSTIQACGCKLCRARKVGRNDPSQTCLSSGWRSNYLMIRTEIIINLKVKRLKHIIDYTCQFDGCNGGSVLRQALDIIHRHYEVSPMLRIFERKPTAGSGIIYNLIQPSLTSAPFRASSTSAPFRASSTSAPFQASSTSAHFRARSTSAPFRASSTSAPVKTTSSLIPDATSSTIFPTESRSIPVWAQSMTKRCSSADRLKVTMKIISFIFQISALLFF